MPDGTSESALALVLAGDPALLRIVWLSLSVSSAAAALAALIGLPFGAWLALTRFPGRDAATFVLNALMGLPPVVVGLTVYLMLSRSGPHGSWGLLFTPQAMVIAQTILIAPIIAALARQTIEDLWSEYRDELAAMDVGAAVRAAMLRGIKVVMSTHDLGQARRLADEIVLMHRGRIVEIADAAAFFNEPRTVEARRFIAGELLV